MKPYPFWRAFPSLERLSLSFKFLDIPSDSHPLFDLSPTLRHITIQHLVDIYMLPDSFLPWHQLTHLHLIEVGFSSQAPLHAVLSCCLNLVACTLDTAISSFTLPDNGLPPIKLQHLTTLKIGDWSMSCGRTLFACLALPSLKRLTVSMAKGECQPSEPAFLIFAQWAGQLEEFGFKNSRDDEFVALYPLLAEMKSLRRLSLGDASLLQHILSRMPDQGFLPQVSLVDCYIHRLSLPTSEVLKDCMQSIRTGPSMRTGVRVIMITNSKTGSMETLKLEISGLNVSLRRAHEYDDLVDYSNATDRKYRYW